jgi:hypothetical protein
MWTRLLLKPWWARALASAGVSAVLVALGWCARWMASDLYPDVLSTLAMHVASIVVFGLLVAVCTTSSHRAYFIDLAGLDPVRRSAAVDASFRGPVPADASVRDVAIRVTQRRLKRAKFWRVFWLVLFCLAVATDVLGLVRSGTAPKADDLMWDAVYLGLTVAAWYVSVSVKHRLQLLRQTGSFDAAATGNVR